MGGRRRPSFRPAVPAVLIRHAGTLHEANATPGTDTIHLAIGSGSRTDQ